MSAQDIPRQVVGKEISHVAVKQDSSLGWIGRAKRGWEVGFDSVTGATEALCVASNANPPVGDRMVRAPGDEEMVRGCCCPRSPATTMKGKSAAAGGSHKFFVFLTTRLLSPQFTSCCHGAASFRNRMPYSGGSWCACVCPSPQICVGYQTKKFTLPVLPLAVLVR